MGKIISFAKLDFITIKPYLTLKNLLVFLFTGLITVFSTGNFSMFIGLFMGMGIVFVSYPFAVGDKNGIDTLYATLSLRRRDVVFGRYMFAFMFIAITGIFALVVSIAVGMVMGKEVNILELLLTFFTCFLIFTTIGAIQLPVFFKFGYTKGKGIAYLPFAAVPLVVWGPILLVGKERAMLFLSQVIKWVTMNSGFCIILVLLLWLGIMVLSCWYADYCYGKREL